MDQNSTMHIRLDTLYSKNYAEIVFIYIEYYLRNLSKESVFSHVQGGPPKRFHPSFPFFDKKINN